MSNHISFTLTERSRIFRILSLFVAVAILLSACGTPTTAPAPTQTAVTVDVNRLYNTLWVLVAYGDPASPTVVEQGLQITASFLPEGEVTGFAGCNNYNGTFTASADGVLSVGPLATTLMACQQNMDLENAYLTAFQASQSFNFSTEGRLEIKYLNPAGKEQTLVYISGKTTLTDNIWVLMSYGDPNSSQTVPANSLITAIFGADGMLSGFSGCNSYSAGYTTQDAQMTFGPIATTLMACPVGMEGEQTYLKALSTVQSYQIIGNSLILTYNQGAEVLNFTSAKLPLDHTLWTLAAVDGLPVSDETQITALFTPGDTSTVGIVSGSSGCNTYNAQYKVDGANITISDPSTTRMACPTGMDIEQSYLQGLQASQSYEIFGDRLLLRTASGTYTFAANRTPLSGALWVLMGMGDVNKPEEPVKGSYFTAQFMRNIDAPSGLLTGTTGCNEYASAYASSLNNIKINLPISTESKSCAPGLVDQEKLYYLALNNATKYQITGNLLVIPYDNDRQALVFVGTQIDVAKRLPLSDLNNTTWYLWYLNNQPVVAGTSISAKFVINPDSSSGTMNGFAGCNNYVATFGENLGMETSLNAHQVCTNPPKVMEQENSYLQVLSRTYGYWQSSEQLMLNSGLGVLTYRKTRPPESYDQTHLLVGTKWYLVSYNNTYSEAGTTEPFTQFSAEGNMTGYTGCNDLQAAYKTEINTISISNLSSSSQDCPNATLTNQEDAMIEILKSAKSYQIADTSMQIVGDKGVLNFSINPINRPDEVQPPTAVIQAPVQALTNEPVNFDGSVSSGQVPIIMWDWDFGDGTKGTGQVVLHVYNQPGTYTVLLVVTDQRNSTASTTQSIAIGVPVPPTQTPAPTAEPSPTPPVGATPGPEPTLPPVATQPPAEIPPQAVVQGPDQGFVGEPMTFDASQSQSGSGPITTYTWDFGDGTSAGPAAEPSQTTIYNQAGTYQVTTMVTDESGVSSSATIPVVVTTRMDTPFVWTLDNLMNNPMLPGTAITLQFQGGEVVGFAGCNSYSGTYTASQNDDGSYSIAIGPLNTSKQICPAEIMQQETNYLASLQSSTIARIQNNLLELTYPEGVINFHELGTSAP